MKVALYDSQPDPKPGDVYVVKEVTLLYIVLEKIDLSAKVELNEDVFRVYMEKDNE